MEFFKKAFANALGRRQQGQGVIEFILILMFILAFVVIFVMIITGEAQKRWKERFDWEECQYYGRCSNKNIDQTNQFHLVKYSVSFSNKF